MIYRKRKTADESTTCIGCPHGENHTKADSEYVQKKKKKKKKKKHDHFNDS